METSGSRWKTKLAVNIYAEAQDVKRKLWNI